VGLSQLGLDRADDRMQARVSGLVTEGVVDLFEVVQVYEKQRDRQTARARAYAGCIETLDERAPIEHTGQWIGLSTALRFGQCDALAPEAVRNSERGEYCGGDHR